MPVSALLQAPRLLKSVEGVIARLTELGAGSVTPLVGIEENVVFPLPKELQSG